MAVHVRKIYIGVAWPYVNDVFHIGNLAGAYLPPDIFARFHKLKGNKVLMVSGSDFHGTPITLRADTEGKRPEEVAQQFHELDKKYLARFRIDYDLYTSTHTDNHRNITHEMFLKLLKNGYVTIQETEQLYSEASQKFLQDRYVEGECPYCHAPDARGDQCEQCGRSLDALELINPASKIDKNKLVKRKTQNYFLNLSKLQDRVGKWLEGNDKLRPWVKQEALGWVKEGLHERAITRDMDYGVPLPIEQIPEDKRIKNIENKVFYVWFEAVIGYLSAAIEYSKKSENRDYWRDFFYDKGGETYYFVGQDNLVFHTINWPAQLIAYDENINLPTNVLVNKFLQLEGQKMSKSRNWFIETPYLLENYSVDAIRFYLTFNAPEQHEANFSWRDFVTVNNSILVGTVGNFIHRTLTLIQKNFPGGLTLATIDPEMYKVLNRAFTQSAKQLEGGQLREALETVIALCTFGNQYIDHHQLWNLVQKDSKKSEDVAIKLLRIIDVLPILLYPFVPNAAEKLAELLGYGKPKGQEGFDQWRSNERAARVTWQSELTPLFIKIPEERIEQERARLKH